MTDTPTDLCGNCGHIRVRHKIGRCSMCSQDCQAFAVTDTPTPTEAEAIEAMWRAPGSGVNSGACLLAMYRAIPGSVHARSAIDKGALVQAGLPLGGVIQRDAPTLYRLASENETPESWELPSVLRARADPARIECQDALSGRWRLVTDGYWDDCVIQVRYRLASEDETP